MAANLKRDEEGVPRPRVIEQVRVVLQADEADRIVCWFRRMFVNVKTKVAMIGMRVSSGKPMIHGMMNR